MKKLNLNEILKILKVNVKEKDTVIHRVRTNIKKIGENTLIFHLNKDVEINQDEFKKYKSCYIVTDQPLLKGFINKDNYIFVDNIINAYRDFINYYRTLFNIKVVAVTGTCGKTTTKEMISQVLKNKYQVVNTFGSRNNIRFHHDYLMKLNDKVEYGVFETAITHPGHLIHSCEVFKPQIGIITNIGIDHLNWCKTLDNYIRTKAELLVGLRNSGYLIINNDDDNIKKIDFSNYKGKVITFGMHNNSNYFGKNIKQEENKVIFTLVKNNKEYSVEVPGNGSHNVYNALAALACLEILGMRLEESILYLSKYLPIRSHTEIKQGINKSLVIDDTWSSNPTSVKAALEVLTNIGKNKTKIAVLGRISYLGKYKQEFYKQIAKDIVSNNVEILITIDDDAKKIGKYAANIGMMPSKIIATNTKEELTTILNKMLNHNTVALFKTSMLDKNSQEILNELVK